jgi:hypothetical protein
MDANKNIRNNFRGHKMKIRRHNPDTLNETKEYLRSKRTNRRRQKRIVTYIFISTISLMTYLFCSSSNDFESTCIM